MVNDDIDVFEKFIGFYEIVVIKSLTIVGVIKDIIPQFNLILDSCRRQWYGRSSNMLGKILGVAVQIKQLQPKIDFTHCHEHSLSLLMKVITKSIKILHETMGTAREIVTLIGYSPKQEKLLGNIEEQFQSDAEDDSTM